MPRYSPDGASLYFFTHEPPSLRRVASSGGHAETVIDGWLWGSVMGAWLDPAGRQIAYTEGTGSARTAKVRELATGLEHALAAPIAVSSWTGAGDAVLGATGEDQILRCPTDGGACEALGKGDHARSFGRRIADLFHRRGRALDDRTLQSNELWVMSAQGKDPRRVATLEPQSTLATRVRHLAARRGVWVQFRRGKEELWLAHLPEEF